MERGIGRLEDGTGDERNLSACLGLCGESSGACDSHAPVRLGPVASAECARCLFARAGARYHAARADVHVARADAMNHVMSRDPLC